MLTGMNAEEARSIDSSARAISLLELAPHLPMLFSAKSKKHDNWVTFRGEVVKMLEIQGGTRIRVVFYTKLRQNVFKWVDVPYESFNEVILYEPSELLQAHQRMAYLESMCGWLLDVTLGIAR